MILSAIWRIGMWGLIGGVVLGGLYGTLFAPIFGTYFGALFGGMVGGVVGILNGLLVGVITRTYFNPLTDPARYRRTIGIASALFTGIAALIGFFMLLGGMVGGQIQLTCWADFVPSLIAGVAALFASRRYAGWYIGDNHKPKKKKHAPD